MSIFQIEIPQQTSCPYMFGKKEMCVCDWSQKAAAVPISTP